MSKLMDDELRRACIAYNSVLLHQPEDCRDQTVAMHAALAPILARLSAAEARVGVLEGALRKVNCTLTVPAAEYVPAIVDAQDIIDAVLTQEPTS
jgi:hypothetical protein